MPRGQRTEPVLRIVTVNLKPYQVDILKAMEREGVVVSRSDAMRNALDDFIRDKLVMMAIQAGVLDGTSMVDTLKKNPPKSRIDMRNRETYDSIRKMFARKGEA